MSTTVNVPTCNYSSYKLSAPYDPDLQTQFNSQLNSDFKNRDDSGYCSICQQNILDLGYSNDLYECSSCLGFSNGNNNYPLLSQAWGCDTCATVVAPVSYYESEGAVVASAEKLKQYLNDLTYKNNVDVKWSSLSRCQKGATVKNICINKDISTFSINVPPENQGPANPQSSSGLSSGILAIIIIFSILGFILLLFIAYGFAFWKKYLYNVRNYL